jgi:hypothetical protein
MRILSTENTEYLYNKLVKKLLNQEYDRSNVVIHFHDNIEDYECYLRNEEYRYSNLLELIENDSDDWPILIYVSIKNYFENPSLIRAKELLESVDIIDITENLFDILESQETISIMIDCLYDSISLSRQTTNETFMKSLSQCAYIQIFLYNKCKNNISLKEIIFVDGVFNKVDNLFLARFINSWIEYIKNDCKVDNVHYDHIDLSQKPKYISEYLGDIDIDCNKKIISLGDINIPYNQRENIVRQNLRKEITNALSSTNATIIRNAIYSLINNFSLPCNKKDIRDYLVLCDIARSKKMKERISKKLNEIILIKFFCDIYKIDIALQNKYIFIKI